MAFDLFWSPTEFFTSRLDVKDRFLQRRSGGDLAMSAGRTWTTSNALQPNYVGNIWHPYRFSMGAAAEARNFISIRPDGNSTRTASPLPPAVSPQIITVAIR